MNKKQITADTAPTQKESPTEQKNGNYQFSTPEENFRRTKIDDIWTMIWVKEKGYAGTIGNRQCTDFYKEEKELRTKLKGVKNGQVDWELIALVSLTISSIERERAELETKINERIEKNG